MTAEGKVRIFDLLAGLTARQRQEFSAERKRRLARAGVREEMVQGRDGRWTFVYFFGTRKFDELPIPQNLRRTSRA